MRRISILLVMLMLFGFTGIVSAADTDSIDLLVTPGVTLAVAITETSYNFGDVDLGTNTVSTEAVTVDTNGADVNQKLQITCANSTDWAVGGTAATDVFEMYGEFSATQPASFTHQITSAGVYVDSNETDVPKDTSKSLWFKLEMPTDSGSGAQQTIAFTVKGVAVP